MNFKFLILFLLVAVTSGCNYFSNSGSDQKTKLQEIETKVTELETKINELELDLNLTKLKDEKYSSANFDPAEGERYQRLDTTSGTLLITLSDVRPYLDGVKVKLKLGNIQSASYSGFVISSEYSRRFPKYIKDQPEQNKKNTEEYERSIRKKEQEFTQLLKAGAWNTVEITLPDIKPTEFGSLEVKVMMSTVRLIQN
jgi:outer membrane murein-binding lipoprotein Lpp